MALEYGNVSVDAYQCPACDEVYEEYETARSCLEGDVLADYHIDVVSVDRPRFWCEFCDSYFKDEQEAQNHYVSCKWMDEAKKKGQIKLQEVDAE
jgi:hypothetical protein